MPAIAFAAEALLLSKKSPGALTSPRCHQDSAVSVGLPSGVTAYMPLAHVSEALLVPSSSYRPTWWL